jgi:hypothetical protein
MLESASARNAAGRRQKPGGHCCTVFYKSLMAFSPPDTLNSFLGRRVGAMQQGGSPHTHDVERRDRCGRGGEEHATVVGRMGSIWCPRAGRARSPVEAGIYSRPGLIQQ